MARLLRRTGLACARPRAFLRALVLVLPEVLQALLSRPRPAFGPGSSSLEAFLHLLHSANALAVIRINAERAGLCTLRLAGETAAACKLMLAFTVST